MTWLLPSSTKAIKTPTPSISTHIYQSCNHSNILQTTSSTSIGPEKRKHHSKLKNIKRHIVLSATKLKRKKQNNAGRGKMANNQNQKWLKIIKCTTGTCEETVKLAEHTSFWGRTEEKRRGLILRKDVEDNREKPFSVTLEEEPEGLLLTPWGFVHVHFWSEEDWILWVLSSLPFRWLLTQIWKFNNLLNMLLIKWWNKMVEQILKRKNECHTT